MSIYGSQVLSDLEAARRQARSHAQADEAAVSGLRARHASANTQLQAAYEKFMQVRTSDPKARRKGLAEVDAWLVDAASAREKSYQQLLVQLTQATELASQLDKALATHTQVRDQAHAAWSGARMAMRDALGQSDAGFIAALQRESDAVRRSQAVDVHLDEISKGTKAFAGECNEDPLFVYCFKRRVGLDGCEGNIITRPLDRLLARATGFYEHRQKLTDAQQDLDRWVKHQALLHAELVDARAGVEAALDAALRTDAGRRLQDDLTQAAAQLATTTQARQQAHAEVDALVTTKAQFDAEQDIQARQMRERVFNAIASASDKALRAAALETASVEDDAAAGEVVELRQQIPDLALQITKAQGQAEQSAEQAKRLDGLVSSFNSRGYNGTYSRFDYGFDTGSLITGVMLGQMSVNQALGRCESSHRDVTPPPPPPPSSSSSSDSGGFSSGGGFGGGGGFSTGGGF